MDHNEAMHCPQMINVLAESTWRTPHTPWGWFFLCVGLAGNGIFATRFLIQWIASERAGRSTVPPIFWWLSLVGAGCSFTYFLYVKDPVGILGNMFNFIPYARNLMMLKKEKEQMQE